MMKASSVNTPADAASGLEMVKTHAHSFDWRDKIGYAFGDLGNCFILGLVNSFLTIYYTNALGISGAIVGGLFLSARFIDAFADVTVGRISDITPLTKNGRFRPWIKWVKYPFCAITVILFLPFVSNWPMIWRVVYIFVTYLVYGILNSCINIPYGSMASAISENPDHRASLSTSRSVGAAIGGAATGFIIPLLVYQTAANGQKVVSANRFFMVSIMCAVIAFACYNVIYRMTTERVQVKKTERVSASKLIKGLFTNKALMALVFADFFLVINQNLSGTLATYLFTDYFQNSTALSIALLFTYGTVVVLAPFATKLIKSFGKKEASIACLAFGTFMYLLMYFLHLTNPWIYLILLFLATLGSGMFNLMVWAFITDVIDYHQYLTGFREDGTVYGVNSFARKCAQAVGGGLGGFMLTAIGYISSTTGGATQSAVVINRIYAIGNLIPAACMLLGMLTLIFFYPLNKKKIDAVDAKLAARRAEELNAQDQEA
ncbi:sugar (Glycoside-Pentoside-Hexuronide) transporter [Lacticaseibacillus zeae DSM 20178 = KCTC 3804]|jgi:GPH family glycoside/pentoside/hexuronide:cation symporter|uniref:Sugar (Glycoside-Pentoside-Hexuronide) transporter n=3 Tax=Lacticaseibacillus zeae TaxID=57037 RepID=A0A0R1EQK3_LACZE|nr:sugar (Glycoside-Pentoside-Hexuronide) transporter [Lacticaseibacillus zeae DSM 20178 = KCTC 3804]